MSPNRFKGVFQGGKSKSPLEFVLLLCRKAKKIRVFCKLTTYVLVKGITFYHLIRLRFAPAPSPQGEGSFGIPPHAENEQKGKSRQYVAIFIKMAKKATY